MRNKVAVFTICSNNYLPYARVLLESVRNHHPDSDLYIGLADELLVDGGIYFDDCEILPARTLGIPDFSQFAFRYNVMELNTAIKPYVFLELLRRGYHIVLYFDPDIEIFRPLESILEPLSSGATFVLTPHLCEPAAGSSHPCDLTIMRAGAYNLGFLGASNAPEVEPLIRWWARRLRYECINAQEKGLFVDQKFIDLLPGFAPRVVVLRDTTVNVAYWNLAQRQLVRSGEGWMVDDNPLSFFHFSGFDPNNLDRLSVHTQLFRGCDIPIDVAAMMGYYANRLKTAGFGSIPAGLYAYRKFVSGTPIPDQVRRMFREWHLTWTGDPFSNYEEYLHLPYADSSASSSTYFVTNLMGYLWSTNPGLSSRFNLNDQRDIDRFVRWYINRGYDLGLDSRLIEPVAVRFGRRRPSAPLSRLINGDRPDVSVIGYLRAASGVGEVGRLTLKSLAKADVKVEGYDVSLNVRTDRKDESCVKYLAPCVSGRIQIYNINADQYPLVLNDIEAHREKDAYRIIVPFWELARFPDAWDGAFRQVEEVWAPTRFIQAGLVRKLSIPVVHMPVALALEHHVQYSREHFSLPNDRFLFLFCFDFLSWVERKNPEAALKAFRLAFSGSSRGSDVALVIKFINGHLRSDKLASFRRQLDDDPDIIVIDKTLSRQETLGLIRNADGIVSLHRSEGLGLLLSEAMLMEKPVVATDYSASTELVLPTTGYPVDYRLVPVEAGQYPYPDDQVWAEPDIEHAAWQMRRLYGDPAEARRRGKAARRHIEKQYNPDRIRGMQLRRLKLIGLG